MEFEDILSEGVKPFRYVFWHPHIAVFVALVAMSEYEAWTKLRMAVESDGGWCLEIKPETVSGVKPPNDAE